MKKWLTILALACMVTLDAQGEENVWDMLTDDGIHLTQICYEPDVGDMYISGDDQLYEVIRLEGDTAIAVLRGKADLPDVSWLDVSEALPVAAMDERRIALYCTHSDESYEPSDGLYSNEERGSIYQVAHALAEELEQNGVHTTVSDDRHYPHDAGAYRRSRQTAVQLLKGLPDALLDIHRDGIPDPDEYVVTIGGKECSKVRLLVGRGNQNMEVNKAFALKVKAVANKVYPGLIKDIYMGKGTYNQDLAPHSLLLECGTYTLDKERVLRSMPMMAAVLNRAMFGGITGSAGTSDVSGAKKPSDNQDVTPGATDIPAQNSSQGVGSGIIWMVVIAAVGLLGFAVAASGSLKGGAGKAGRHLSEMTGGLLGKKPRDDEEPPHS